MSRVLVIAAHPDDEVLGMGGTIALHATVRQDAVRIVCVTDGSSTQYPGDAEKRAQKEEEARAAAAELGVTDYVHLDLPDMRQVTTYFLMSIDNVTLTMPRNDVVSHIRS